MPDQPPPSMAEMERTARAGWERNAEYWDDHLGDEGDDFHRALVAPAAIRLLGLRPGQRLLEVACGNGAFARTMARAGVRVVALDYSETMVELAKSRSRGLLRQITYHVADATDVAALRALGARPFDAAVCNMTLMGVPNIEPLYAAVAAVLKPQAPFVVSVLHPAFATTLSHYYDERVKTPDGERPERGLKVARYKSPFSARGVAIIGQPVPQYYFHRPLEALLAGAFAAGFVLDALEEPIMPPHDPPRLMWEALPEMPPVLVVRLRRAR